MVLEVPDASPFLIRRKFRGANSHTVITYGCDHLFACFAGDHKYFMPEIKRLI
jgi:hypothetical protein